MKKEGWKGRGRVMEAESGVGRGRIVEICGKAGREWKGEESEGSVRDRDMEKETICFWCRALAKSRHREFPLVLCGPVSHTGVTREVANHVSLTLLLDSVA